MRINKLFILSLVVAVFSQNVFARSFRATDLSGELVSEILNSRGETNIVEFRERDQIPVNFEAEGDLFDSKDNINSILNIKKTFWLKIENSSILVSYDGTDYLSFKDALKGSFTTGADLDPSKIPALIKIMLAVYLK